MVAAEPEALRAAAGRLDRGAGTAWAGDARQGFNGGAQLLRWVRGEEDAAEAARFLAERCDRARVMPFLEGIPCSIHGMVFPGGVAAFRPVEMVTLRQPGGPGSARGGPPENGGRAGCGTRARPPSGTRPPPTGR